MPQTDGFEPIREKAALCDEVFLNIDEYEAIRLIDEAGIKLYGGVVGDADNAVKSLLEDSLNYNTEIECNHHHNDEHSCGEHSCS